MEPAQLSPDAVHNPHFTLEEIYRTLIFFRDNEVSAHKIAAKRDNARFLKSQGVTNPTGLPTSYIGPGGIRTFEQMKNDMDKCAKCGMPQ